MSCCPTAGSRPTAPPRREPPHPISLQSPRIAAIDHRCIVRLARCTTRQELTRRPDSDGYVTDADLARALIEGQVWAISQTWYRFAPDVVMLAKRTLGSESE